MAKVFLKDSLILLPEIGDRKPILLEKTGAGAVKVRASIVATSVKSFSTNLERAIKSASDPISDFYARNQDIEWAEDEEGVKEVVIERINEDAIVEQPEMFYVRLLDKTEGDPPEFGLDTCYCFIIDGDGSAFFGQYVTGELGSPEQVEVGWLDSTNWGLTLTEPWVAPTNPGKTVVRPELDVLVDDDPTTGYESFQNLSGGNMFLEIDLQEPKYVSRIRIAGEHSRGDLLLTLNKQIWHRPVENVPLNGDFVLPEKYLVRYIRIESNQSRNLGNHNKWRITGIDILGDITAEPISPETPVPSPSPTPSGSVIPQAPPVYTSEEIDGYSANAYPRSVNEGEDIFIRWQTPTGVPTRESTIAAIEQGKTNGDFGENMRSVNLFEPVVILKAPYSPGLYQFKYMINGNIGNYDSVATSPTVRVYPQLETVPDILLDINPKYYLDTRERFCTRNTQTNLHLSEVRSHVGHSLTQDAIAVQPSLNHYYGTMVAELDGQKQFFDFGKVELGNSGCVNFLIYPENRWHGCLYSTDKFALNIKVDFGDISRLSYHDNNEETILGVLPVDRWVMVTINFQPGQITYYVNGAYVSSDNIDTQFPTINDSAFGYQMLPISNSPDVTYFKGQLLSLAFFDRLSSQDMRDIIKTQWERNFGLTLPV